jgi:hypothetical protein
MSGARVHDLCRPVHDDNYKPVASACPALPDQPPPAQELFLADVATGAKVKRVFNAGINQNFPHYRAEVEPAFCSSP